MPDQVLLHIARRRHRSFLIASIALVLFATAWIYGGFAIQISGPRRSASRDGTYRHPTPTTEGHIDGESTQDHATGNKFHIPPKIWQILLPKKPSAHDPIVDPQSLRETPTWLAMNPGYTYTLVNQRKADEFLQRRFASEPRIIEAYNSLPNVGMKSDLLRYLLLGEGGGVYSDIDTVALKPIDDWVPADIRDRVRLVVGIEFDRRDGGGWADIPHWLQFCQWTIAAAPGHPVFQSMVARVLQSLADLSETHGVPVDQLHPTSFEVMNSTGPAAWTDVVFQQLQLHDPTLNSTRDLSFISEPKLFGDILILTIDGFGMGQSHSHSTHDGTVPEAALAKHLFRGSWRGD